MTKYEKYCKLRNSKNLRDSDVARATEIGKSTFSDWKSGRSEPKNAKLQRIAEFLGVSINYFTDDNAEHPIGYYLNEETAAMAQAMFDDPDMRALFDMKRNMPPERFAAHVNFMKELYENEKNTHYND